ncbi:MAG: hypothetical protein ACI9MC_004142, partial [Kiritimatiellia bacterium]
PEPLQPIAEAYLLAAQRSPTAARLATDHARDSEERLAQATALQVRDGETAALLRTVSQVEQAYAIVLAEGVALSEVTAIEATVRDEIATYQRDLVHLADPESRAKVDANLTYSKVRTLQGALRKQAWDGDRRLADLQRKIAVADKRVLVDLERIEVERGKLSSIDDPIAARQRAAALDDWSRLAAEEKSRWKQQLDDVSRSREEALKTLPRAVTLRRGLRVYVNAEQRGRDSAVLVPELIDELSVVGPTYLATQRDRLRGVSNDPFWFFDLNLLYSLLQSMMWLVVAAGVWWGARRYARGLVEQALTRVTNTSDHVRPEDVVGLREPLHRVFVTLVDVCAAWAVSFQVPEGLPELSVVLLLVFEIQLVRLTLALFDVLVIRPPSVRPSLVRLSKPAWLTARRTVQVFALWFVVRRVLLVFATDVLHGFASEQLVRLVATLAFVVLSIVFLYAWAPHTRHRVSKQPVESWLTRLLGTRPSISLLNGPQALGGVVFLAFVIVRSLAFRIARSGGGPLGLFTAIDRLRLGRRVEEVDAVEPLSVEIRTALREAGRQREVIDRVGARQQMFQALAGWEKEQRQGLVALLGDDGDGRATALRSWEAAWLEQGLAVYRVSLDRRLRTEHDALSWLHRALDLPRIPTDPDDAVELLAQSLEPGIWVVERANMAFLRTVGGFGAFQTLLYVLHGDGEERFWLLSVYRPAWRYLERLASLFSMHMFRTVVDLKPLSDKDLYGLTMRMAERAGYELDFSDLVSKGALAGDPQVEAQRAKDSFYRVLASASAGNPAVALDLWLNCLSERSEGGRVLAVHLDQCINVGPIVDMTDDHLFVLAALRTQGQLGVPEVAEVTNMNPFQVRALVRTLESRGILLRESENVQIERAKLPVVTLTLRRRHFVHWG